MKTKFFTLYLLFTCTISGQVAINTTGNAPHASAMLDVAGTGKGILIPRMTAAQRDAIAAPATGLLVYVTDDNGFYYFNGTQWLNLGGAQKINDLIDGKSDNDGTNDYSSVFLGFQAGFNDDQSDNRNVGIGFQTLYSNTLGEWNTATGYQALFANTTGSRNTATGYQALFSNTTGRSNTAAGALAMFSNTTGIENSAFGVYTLYSNVTGNYNTAVGYNALYHNTTGSHNTASGAYALLYNVTGNYNTALGYGAFSNGTNFNNSTALGYNTTITASNQIRLGNTSVTSIGGYANWTNLSDKRFKTDIRENVPGMELVMKLRPVTYHLNTDALARWLKTPDSLRLPEAEKIKAKELQIGFIAQEVEKAAQELGFDFHAVDKPKNDNDAYGLRYSEFVPVLVKALQEQKKLIEQLDQQNKIQTETIRQLKNELNSLKKKIPDSVNTQFNSPRHLIK